MREDNILYKNKAQINLVGQVIVISKVDYKVRRLMNN